MRNLNNSVAEKYAYVKNGVIFKVTNYDNGDSCAVKIFDENCPSITVNGKRLYLDNYIEVGDIYENGSFMKTVHDEEASGEEQVTFQEFYKKECEDTIGNALVAQYTKTYDDFLNDLSQLGVPTFMFEQSSDSVEGIEQIDFTEVYYNDSKENEVEKLALQAASDTAFKYGYKLLTTSLDLEKI